MKPNFLIQFLFVVGVSFFSLHLNAQCNIIYVTPTGCPTCPGTKASPMNIATAFNSAPKGSIIKLAIGTYTIDNSLSLFSDSCTIEGGFDNSVNWSKTSQPGASTIFRSSVNPEGSIGNGRLVAIYINSKSGFRFQDVTISTANAITAGTSTYGIHLTNCSDYNFTRTRILPGNASAGANGSPGATGQNGANGINGTNGNHENENTPGLGGMGGNGAGTGFGAGGAGGIDVNGSGSCCLAGQAGSAGTPSGNLRAGGGGGGGAAGGEEAKNGGTGGQGGGVNGGSGQTPGGGGGAWGDPGNAGGDGTNGLAGSNGSIGTNVLAGTHTLGFYITAAGSSGTDGSGGKGGSGGGGGGGQFCTFCVDGAGNGGGGGGGGAEGGQGGNGGQGGGSSYGIYLYNNGSGGLINQSYIIGGTVGASGSGGAGGSGGTGGNGGLGASFQIGEIGRGGNGGKGGNGGNGGNGGDGAPGESFSYYLASGAAITSISHLFNLNAQPVITSTEFDCSVNSISYTAGTSVAWDLGSGASPQTPSGTNVTTTYNSNGRKDITAGTDMYAGFVFITCPTWYADYDNDGLGDNNVSVVSCTQPANFVAGYTDVCPFADQATLTNFNTSTCNCLPGYYQTTNVVGGNTIITACTICPAGSYCPDGIASIKCNAGKYSATLGNIICYDCGPGTYSDTLGAVSCTNCLAGTSNPLNGQTFCPPCGINSYSSTNGQANCNTCPIGFYAPAGSSSCTPCPTITFNETHVEACPGTMDGSITLSNEIGGTGPYTYSMNNGSNYVTGNQFINLAPGIYQTKIKDSFGCESAAMAVNINDQTGPTMTCPGNMTQVNGLGQCGATVNFATPTATDNCVGPTSGNALDFDGVDDFVHTDYANYTFNHFTLETWINVAVYNDNVHYISLYKNAFLVLGDYATGSISTWADGLNPIQINSSLIPTTNTWHHIAFTYDGGSQKIYIDGVLDQNVPTTGSVTHDSTMYNEGLNIGSRYSSVTQFVNGKMDGVRIWNVARTQTEIQASMNTDLGTMPGLVTNYTLNHGIACATNTGLTNAVDYSGNSNNGTLSNFDLTGTLSDPCQSNWTNGVVSAGPSANVVCTPASGSFFSLGTTTVNCVATDLLGNTSTCSFSVTVTDTTMPIIVCPSTISSASPVVNYTVTASDACSAVTLSYSHPSGSTFPCGVATVTVTATDAHNHQSTCTFDIDVTTVYQTPLFASVQGCYTWPVNGNQYTVSGIYSHTLMSSNGCDSVLNLNLTITPGVFISPKVVLGGDYDLNLGLMHDSLRFKGLIPLTEPYTNSPYNKTPIGGPSGETMLLSVLSSTGPTAIVDWILLELRDAMNSSTIVANKRALLQRNGNIVATDGSSAVEFPTVSNGSYFLSVKHRNHLGIMTANAIALNGCSSTSVDLSTSSPVHNNLSISNAPRKLIGGVYAMWPSDANHNKNVKYNGISNDKDPVLAAIGGNNFIQSTVWNVYRVEDVNMDGKIRYNGLDNDRTAILNTVGVNTPNVILNQHTPN